MGIIVKRAIITQNDEDDDSLTRSPLLLVLRSLGVFKYGRGYAKNVSRF